MTDLNLSARPDLRPVLWAAPLAGVLAALVNVLIWWLARDAFTGLLVGPPDRRMPFAPGAIVVLSLAGALGAGMVYALLASFTRRPNAVFTWVALTVLLLSFATPLTLSAPPVAVVVALEAMHVVSAALVLWLVPRRT